MIKPNTPNRTTKTLNAFVELNKDVLGNSCSEASIECISMLDVLRTSSLSEHEEVLDDLQSDLIAGLTTWLDVYEQIVVLLKDKVKSESDKLASK